jgi:hypothetical protein
MDLRPTSNAVAAAKIGNPEGCFLAGAWLRCSSVTGPLAMLLHRVLPAARQKTARPFLILIWAPNLKFAKFLSNLARL